MYHSTYSRHRCRTRIFLSSLKNVSWSPKDANNILRSHQYTLGQWLVCFNLDIMIYASEDWARKVLDRIPTLLKGSQPFIDIWGSLDLIKCVASDGTVLACFFPHDIAGEQLVRTDTGLRSVCMTIAPWGAQSHWWGNFSRSRSKKNDNVLVYPLERNHIRWDHIEPPKPPASLYYFSSSCSRVRQDDLYVRSTIASPSSNPQNRSAQSWSPHLIHGCIFIRSWPVGSIYTGGLYGLMHVRRKNSRSLQGSPPMNGFLPLMFESN